MIHLATAYSDDVIGIASDTAATNREGLDALKKALTDGKIEVVYTLDIGQFGSGRKYLECLELMIEKNVEIITQKDKYPTESLKVLLSEKKKEKAK